MNVLVPLLSVREGGKFISKLERKDLVYLALIVNPKKHGPMKFRLFFTRLERMKKNLMRLQNILKEKGMQTRDLVLWGDTLTELKNIIRTRKIERIIIKKQNKSIGSKLRRYCRVVFV
jgi:hypothetical protein